MFKSLCFLYFVITITLMTSGCYQTVYSTVIPNHKTASYIAPTTTVGAAVGAAATSTIGVPGGLILGGIIGGYANSKEVIIHKLEKGGAKVITIGDTTTVLLPADRFFDPKDDLMPYGDYPLLDDVVDLMNKFGNSVVKVGVSTDNVDTNHRNYVLSKRQAHRVSAYLWHRGINAWRLYPVPYGQHMKVATNKTVMGSFYNRCVEITTNPYITPASCCAKIAHFKASKRDWQFWGQPYN